MQADPQGARGGVAPLAEGSTRRMPRALVVGTLVLAAVHAIVSVDEHLRPLELRDLVTWRTPEEAERISRATGRPVLYVFAAAWCEPCRQLQSQVFGDREYAAFVDATFVPVRLEDRRSEDGANSSDVEELQQRFEVVAFPTLVVVPARGAEPVVIRGFGGPARVMAHLRRAASGQDAATRP